MKRIRIFITALLLAGSVAGNAQGVNDTKQDGVVYKYSTYCFESDKASGSTKALAFNTHQKTLFLLTPKGDKNMVEKTIKKYFKKYKSLKNADYQAIGEIHFANEEAAKAFEQEATKKLKKIVSVPDEKIVSYNAETGQPGKLIQTSTTYGGDMDLKMIQGFERGESIDNFIKRETNGLYTSKSDFDKAYKAKEPEALKYAEKMKRP